MHRNHAPCTSNLTPLSLHQALSWRVRPSAAAIPFNPRGLVPVRPDALFEEGGALQLFEAGSTIEMTLDGNLSFSLAPQRNGMVRLEVVLMDNGGTLNGGVDVSEPAYIDLEVLPVNQVRHIPNRASPSITSSLNRKPPSQKFTHLNPSSSTFHTKVKCESGKPRKPKTET